MYTTTLIISKKAPKHFLPYPQSYRRAKRCANEYQKYINEHLQRVHNALLMMDLINHYIDSVSLVSIDTIVIPQVKMVRNNLFFNTKQCDTLVASVTYKISVRHEDINYMKLKHFEFYDLYIYHRTTMVSDILLTK